MKIKAVDVCEEDTASYKMCSVHEEFGHIRGTHDYLYLLQHVS